MSEATTASEAREVTPRFRWKIGVLEYNHYGDRVVTRTPMTVEASTKAEVTVKVRIAFDATYDEFRKFWSHGWTLESVEEVQGE